MKSHKKALSMIPLLVDDSNCPEKARAAPLSPQGSPGQATVSRRKSETNSTAPQRSIGGPGTSTAVSTTVTTANSATSATSAAAVASTISMSRQPSASLRQPQAPPVACCIVDNRAASVTCLGESVFINYETPSPWACVSKCLPRSISATGADPQRLSEDVPYSEILSAELYVSKGSASGWLSFAKPGETYELELYTFVRSKGKRSEWAPRVITVSSPDRGLVELCHAEIQRHVQEFKDRPKSLLVLINPYGGSKKAGSVYEREVKPVFEKAGIKTTLCTTRYSGDAKDTICRMFGSHVGSDIDDRSCSTPPESDIDGLVAIGGDGLFHEMVAGLLEVNMEHRIRVAHVAAGSTDAVACTLNGTRSAFTAAVHVALGDSVALDVLRLDTELDQNQKTIPSQISEISQKPTPTITKFTMSMASYGFFGNVMQESEKVRWLGPMRYDLVGARMWMLNKSYRARIEYLAAPPDTSMSQIVCTKDCPVCLQPPHKLLNPASKSFRLHAQESRARFMSEWKVVEDNFAGIMLVIIPCRSDKSKEGVCKYSHLSDGRIHLVMIKACSRWQYLKFLLRLSKYGLESGDLDDGIVKVEACAAVKITHMAGNTSNVWNVDGELVRGGSVVYGEVHRSVLNAFSRGIEE